MENNKLWSVKDIIAYVNSIGGKCGYNKAIELRRKAINEFDGGSKAFPRLVWSNAVIKAIEEKY